MTLERVPFPGATIGTASHDICSNLRQGKHVRTVWGTRPLRVGRSRFSMQVIFCNIPNSQLFQGVSPTYSITRTAPRRAIKHQNTVQPGKLYSTGQCRACQTALFRFGGRRFNYDTESCSHAAGFQRPGGSRLCVRPSRVSKQPDQGELNINMLEPRRQSRRQILDVYSFDAPRKRNVCIMEMRSTTPCLSFLCLR